MWSTIAVAALLSAGVQDEDPPSRVSDEEPYARAANQAEEDEERVGEGFEQSVDTAVLKARTQGWPAASRKAALAVAKKHGQPDEVSSSQLVWRDAGLFRRIVVSNEEVEHRFPAPHKDVVEHVIDYKVPVDKVDELARFDGSLLVDRTRGTLAARGDTEEANLVALNLAHDIIRDRRTVDEARDLFAAALGQQKAGTKPVIAQRLQFDTVARTADPDAPAQRAMGK